MSGVVMVYPFKSIHSVDDASLKDSVTEEPSAESTNMKKRNTAIDETLLPPNEAEKLLAKRAYNRDCAERARKRSKQMIEELHCKIKELQEDKDELRRSIGTLEKQLLMLQKQNDDLLLKEMFQANGTSYHRNRLISYNQTGTTSLNVVLPPRSIPFPALMYDGEHSKLTSNSNHNGLWQKRRK
jgi:chromosome segregation ATPase